MIVHIKDDNKRFSAIVLNEWTELFHFIFSSDFSFEFLLFLFLHRRQLLWGKSITLNSQHLVFREQFLNNAPYFVERNPFFRSISVFGTTQCMFYHWIIVSTSVQTLAESKIIAKIHGNGVTPYKMERNRMIPPQQSTERFLLYQVTTSISWIDFIPLNCIGIWNSTIENTWKEENPLLLSHGAEEYYKMK